MDAGDAHARYRWTGQSQDAERLLRTFGYGTPDRERLFYSAGNVLTLIAQDSLQPFFEDEEGGIKTRDIKFHTLPWPRDALLALPLNAEVQLRVTLSYFIEPSPGERGWDRIWLCLTCLRFKVIRAAETLNEFKLRVNAHGRDEDYDEDHVGETGNWALGLRTDQAHSFKCVAWVRRRPC